MSAIETAIAEGRTDDIPKYLTDRWLADVTLFGRGVAPVSRQLPEAEGGLSYDGERRGYPALLGRPGETFGSSTLRLPR